MTSQITFKSISVAKRLPLALRELIKGQQLLPGLFETLSTLPNIKK